MGGTECGRREKKIGEGRESEGRDKNGIKCTSFLALFPGTRPTSCRSLAVWQELGEGLGMRLYFFLYKPISNAYLDS